MENIEKLVKLQDGLMNQLNDVSINIKQELNADRSVKLYERRIQSLNELYDKFKENHYQICMADDADSSTEYLNQRKLSDFDKRHFELINELEEKMASLSTVHFINPTDSTHMTPASPFHKSRVKLPPISLPKFDGTYKSWRAFKDLYVNLIHDNEEISNIEKLHYLKSCVSGEAARIIKSFEIIGENYNKAWQALDKRFNNNRVLINTQLEKLCRINPVKTENAQSMKDVLSNTEEILHELKTLNVNIENWDPIIVYLTVQKLSPETRELWEIKQSEKIDVASFKELSAFLEARFRALEAINVPKRSNVFFTQNKGSNQNLRCLKCNSEHRLFNCDKFKSLSAAEKLNFIKKNKLCMNCFTSGHNYNECRSKYTCSMCKKKHHSLLHGSFNTMKQVTTSAQSTHINTGDKAPPAATVNEKNEIKTFFSSNLNQALLATALVRIKNTQGQNEVLRALVDSGSQATFITAAAAKRLRLKTKRTSQQISGLNMSNSTVATSQTEFELESVYSTFKKRVNALVVKSITNDLPTYTIKTAGFNHLKNLQLADPRFEIPGKVDILIGAEVYAAIIREGIKRSNNLDHPIAINTALGWIVMGSTGHTAQSCQTFMTQVREEDNLDKQLRKFWKQEEIVNHVHIKPEWLNNENLWPKQPKILDAVEERKPQKTFFSVIEPEILTRYSSYRKLLRVTAYCIRFMNNCRSKEKIKLGYLNQNEIEQAEILLIKMIQQAQFASEIKALKGNQQLHKNSKILNLNPFLDNLGILRVGGRLRNSNLTFNEKHPIILPSNHVFSNLLIKHIHEETCHGGLQLVLNTIRTRFWIINAKNTIRYLLRKCINCFRVKPHDNTQLMYELPAARITQSFPFQHVGIDFAGPIDMKTSSIRNAKVIPVYICLFICLSTKAVHIELVTNLSAEAFIASFNRFINRRGLCSDIYSDCGTNFVKANKIMFSKETNERIADILANKRIKWHFNPPSAPHFGGLWESHIKLIKTHLKKTLQNTKLTFEGLYTVLCNIEACINSRPLSPINIDPDDDTVITPGHFLIHRNLQVVPECNEYNVVPTKQLQFLKQLQQNFWYSWSKEYLHQLQVRYKWKYKNDNLKVGDIVILKRDNFPPLMWPLGKIIETYAGNDGLVRTALVKIAQKTYLRPTIKLYKLPLSGNEISHPQTKNSNDINLEQQSTMEHGSDV